MSASEIERVGTERCALDGAVRVSAPVQAPSVLEVPAKKAASATSKNID